jgi:hypothetical protein
MPRPDRPSPAGVTEELLGEVSWLVSHAQALDGDFLRSGKGGTEAAPMRGERRGVSPMAPEFGWAIRHRSC